MDGEWAPVHEFPGYSVNPSGEVRRDATGRVLTVRMNQYGVPYVGLMRSWRQCLRSLPRLVAVAFVPQPSEIFNTPINLNGDRMNCHASNLLWRPRWYAVRYVNQFVKRYERPINAQIREAETGEVFKNSFVTACTFGLLESQVVESIHARTLAWPTYQQFEVVE
jgi:hypothetical protein